MTRDPTPNYDQLWKEYSLVFQDMDDLSLGRWMAQTLGQLAGRIWRFSHPLLGAYRMAAQLAQDRQIWLKGYGIFPAHYAATPCCRAPLFPVLTRDVTETGLICAHCGETAVPMDELPDDLRKDLSVWAEEYAPHHKVAHWEEERGTQPKNFNQLIEESAQSAEKLLVHAGTKLAPQLLDLYTAAGWEDQDECLEVRPEDVIY